MSIGFTAKLERPSSSIYNGSILSMQPSKASVQEHAKRELGPMEQFIVRERDGRRVLQEREPRNDGVAFYFHVKELP
jgi:hypothetical protein